MCTEQAPATHKPPEPLRVHAFGGRVASLLEVSIAFALVHLSYRSFKHFTALGKLEELSGLNYSPGVTMILFTLVAVLLRRRNFGGYGLTLQGWRYQLNAALLWTLVLAGTAALVLFLAPVRLKIGPPSTLVVAFACSLGIASLMLLLGVFLRKDRTLVLSIPPVVTFLVLAGLLLLPMMVAWHFNHPLLKVFLLTISLFLCAGFGEELFFRGYIQSRVNQAFGRPYQCLGVSFGAGLLVASLLFGFIHALNTVNYFTGRFDFAWPWCFLNFFIGLLLGCLRERTGSILPGALVHGLGDLLGKIPMLFP